LHRCTSACIPSFVDYIDARRRRRVSGRPAFHVPTTGTYDLSVAQTKAADDGTDALALDGRPVRTAYDATGPVTAPIDEGTVSLMVG